MINRTFWSKIGIKLNIKIKRGENWRKISTRARAHYVVSQVRYKSCLMWYDWILYRLVRVAH